MSEAHSPEPVLQLMQAFQASAVLRACIELEVFDRLADGPAGASAVGAACGADERGMRILLDAGTALGLLHRADGAYTLTPLARTFLVSSSPTCVAGLSRIFTSRMLWESMWDMPDAVRRGGAVRDDHAEVPEHPFWEDFAESIAAMAAPASAAMADLLGQWTGERDPLSVLDVACGNGMYGFAIAESNAQARVTSLDWGNVLPTARGLAEAKGLTDRVTFVEGDAFEADLGGPHDLVLASHIFHHFDEERCAELVGRMAAALSPGGRLVVHDFIPSGDPAGDPSSYMFSVIMLNWTQNGEAHPQETYERLFRGAGLSAAEAHDVPGLPTRVLVAEKT